MTLAGILRNVFSLIMETLINEVENLFAQSDLPEVVNSSLTINALVKIRTKIYG